jgi:putative transposase
MYITVRRGDSYAKEAVHITYGVRADHRRELLDLSLNPSESSSSWGDFITKLKQRRVEKMDLIVVDGLKGLEGEIHRVFPGTVLQKYVVHKMNCVQKQVFTR